METQFKRAKNYGKNKRFCPLMLLNTIAITQTKVELWYGLLFMIKDLFWTFDMYNLFFFSQKNNEKLWKLL